jgi:hypothetical protein
VVHRAMSLPTRRTLLAEVAVAAPVAGLVVQCPAHPHHLLTLPTLIRPLHTQPTITCLVHSGHLYNRRHRVT